MWVVLLLAFQVHAFTCTGAGTGLPVPGSCEANATCVAPRTDRLSAALARSVHLHTQNGLTTTLVDRRTAGEDWQTVLAELCAVPLERLSKNDYLATLVNAYNAFVVDVLLDDEKRGSVSMAAFLEGTLPSDGGGFALGNRRVTLQELSKLALELLGPSAIGSLACGAVGCPDLVAEPLTGAGLGEALPARLARWLSSPKGAMVDGDVLYVSSRFLHLGVGEAEARALARSVMGLPNLPAKFAYLDFDWTLPLSAPEAWQVAWVDGPLGYSAREVLSGIRTAILKLAVLKVPHPSSPDDSCIYGMDGKCDEPHVDGGVACAPGSDATDCAGVSVPPLDLSADIGEELPFVVAAGAAAREVAAVVRLGAHAVAEAGPVAVPASAVPDAAFAALPPHFGPPAWAPKAWAAEWGLWTVGGGAFAIAAGEYPSRLTGLVQAVADAMERRFDGGARPAFVADLVARLGEVEAAALGIAAALDYRARCLEEHDWRAACAAVTATVHFAQPLQGAAAGVRVLGAESNALEAFVGVDATASWEGCGWRLRMDTACQPDHNELSAFVIGFVTRGEISRPLYGSAAVAEACGRAASAGYCSRPLVRALCGRSCGVCGAKLRGDQDAAGQFEAAARELLLQWENRTWVGACARLCGQHDDRVIPVLCDCAKLMDVGLNTSLPIAPPLAPDLTGDPPPVDCEGGENFSRVVQWLHDSEWFAPAGAPAGELSFERCANRSGYITKAFTSCAQGPASAGRRKEDGFGAAVFPGSVVVPFPGPRGHAESCLNKCGGRKPCAGSNCFCGGYDLFGRPDKDVLCLPRDQCEALCTSLPSCVGFEMHDSKPRCTLFSALPDAGCDASSQTHLVVKSPRTAAYPTKFSGRTCSGSAVIDDADSQIAQHFCAYKCWRFKTTWGAAGTRGCSSASAKESGAICLERPDCEAACDRIAQCSAVRMGPGGVCFLISSAGKSIDAVCADAGIEDVAVREPSSCGVPELDGKPVDAAWDEQACRWVVQGTSAASVEDCGLRGLEEGGHGRKVVLRFTEPSKAEGVSVSLNCASRESCPPLTRCVFTDAGLSAALEEEGVFQPGGIRSELAGSRADCTAFLMGRVSRAFLGPGRAELFARASGSTGTSRFRVGLRGDSDAESYSAEGLRFAATEALHRAAPGSPRFMVLPLAEDADVHLRVMVAQRTDIKEIGQTYPAGAPDGAAFVISDVLRVEALTAAGCELQDVQVTVESSRALNAWIYDSSNAALRAGPLRTTAAIGGQIATGPSGDWLFTAAGPAPCACGSDASCLDDGGCVCAAGFAYVDGSCFALPPLPAPRVRITPTASVDLWTVSDVRLYSDSHCSQAISAVWSSANACEYPKGMAVETVPGHFPRQLFAAHLCRNKCSSQPSCPNLNSNPVLSQLEGAIKKCADTGDPCSAECLQARKQGPGHCTGIQDLEEASQRLMGAVDRCVPQPNDIPGECAAKGTALHPGVWGWDPNVLCGPAPMLRSICDDVPGCACVLMHAKKPQGVLLDAEACARAKCSDSESVLVQHEYADGWPSANGHVVFSRDDAWTVAASSAVDLHLARSAVDSVEPPMLPTRSHWKTEWWLHDETPKLELTGKPGLPAVSSVRVAQSALGVRVQTGRVDEEYGSQFGMEVVPDFDMAAAAVADESLVCISWPCAKLGFVPEGEEIRRTNANACDCRRECDLDPTCAAFAVWSLEDNHGEDEVLHTHTACILYSNVEKIVEVSAPGETWEGALLPRALSVSVTPAAQVSKPFDVHVLGKLLAPGQDFAQHLSVFPHPKLFLSQDDCKKPAAAAYAPACAETHCTGATRIVSPDELAWEAIVYVPGTYSVCWCANDCATTGAWHSVGEIDVHGPRYSWALEANDTLRISRLPFSGTSSSSDWRIGKLEPFRWDCDAVTSWQTPIATDYESADFEIEPNLAPFRVCVLDAEPTTMMVGSATGDVVVRALPALAPPRKLTFDVTQNLPFTLTLPPPSAEGDTVYFCGTNTSIGFAMRSGGGVVVRGPRWPTSDSMELCLDGQNTSLGTAVVADTLAVQQVFVVDADEKASLEIVGRGLTHAARVMLIRDGDVCGMHGVPLEVTPGQFSPVVAAGTVSVSDFAFTKVMQSLVPGGDLPAPAPSSGCGRCAPGRRVLRNYSILEGRPDLSLEEVLAADPLCAGYEDGDEDGDGTAVCATEATCRSLCAADNACTSVDVHATKPRCRLNRIAVTLPTGVERSVNYNLLLKAPVHVGTATEEVFSTSTRLLFGNVSVPAGEFKVCFCKGHCRAPSDFAVEVGRVIASGVSCLLSLPKHGCVEMPFGGLRCTAAVLPSLSFAPKP